MSTTTETPHKVKHRTGAGARFNADHIGIYRAVNLGVLISALAAVLISWNGLAYVGQWLLLPPHFTWLVPVMIDVPIVVFTLATLSRRSRGESIWLLNFAAYLLTSISALANFLHVAAERPLNTIEGAVGSSLAALAPMLVLLTTEALGTLITKPPSENSPRSKMSRLANELKEAKSRAQKAEKALKAAENPPAPEPRIVEVPIELTDMEIMARAQAIAQQGSPPAIDPNPSAEVWWRAAPRH
ncbi:MAG: hypothetical protein K0S65_3647 [Labilithrix sp.]|nr:hypothetical protein [Labilithrix sp.]